LKYANEFIQYRLHFGKNYGSDEGFYRYTVFAANMEIINAQNELFNNGTSTFFLGVNAITDLTMAEYKAQLLGYKRTTLKSGLK